MQERYILGIDQSTSGTKALLLDGRGDVVCRADIPHRQIVNDLGWIGHNLMEIYSNTIEATKRVICKSGIDKQKIAGIGISNQRETAAVWDRETGAPVCDAIVWQCARGEPICKRLADMGHSDRIGDITGLPLSPYFSAAKIAWVLENAVAVQPCTGVPQPCAGKGVVRLCAGTIDSWLIYKLTGNFGTDYSNASRTQLFDIHKLEWSREVCALFGIDPAMLPVVLDSDSCFGYTDLEGFLGTPAPVHGVMGDSHGALFGQGCHSPGMMKATYGTGSSVMMYTGDKPASGHNGTVTSIAWSTGGKVGYVLEGNINYSGAVLKWLSDDLGLIATPDESSQLASRANPEDGTYLVPAFSGLGAPHWDSGARALMCGMSRTTGKNEIVKAAVESIAYQINDVIQAMLERTGAGATVLLADGGPVGNEYLMQFQSDISGMTVIVPEREELSGIGVSYMAGIALGVYELEELFRRIQSRRYTPSLGCELRIEKLNGWKSAVQKAIY